MVLFFLGILSIQSPTVLAAGDSTIHFEQTNAVHFVCNSEGANLAFGVLIGKNHQYRAWGHGSLDGCNVRATETAGHYLAGSFKKLGAKIQISSDCTLTFKPLWELDGLYAVSKSGVDPSTTVKVHSSSGKKSISCQYGYDQGLSAPK